MPIPWIVKGDKTTHGGTVLEGDPTFDSHGKPVSLVGHMTSCPKCKGGPFPIVTGAPDFVSNGRPVARHGDKTACGALLISGQVYSNWGDESGHSVRPASAALALVRQAPANADPSGFDEHFVLKEKDTGKPVAGFAYRLQCSSTKHDGQTGPDGKTAYAFTETPEPVSLQYAVQIEVGVRE